MTDKIQRFDNKNYLASGEQQSLYRYYDIKKYAKDNKVSFDLLPYSIRILLEGALRQYDGVGITSEHLQQLVHWNPNSDFSKEVPFIPSRIILQDFTGVPAVVDLAAMRTAVKEAGGDPDKINPIIPVDLVIDHSVMVDTFGNKEALNKNIDLEYERNDERYRFLRWAGTAFNNFNAVPPATGIIHQVNLEYLASVAMTKEEDGQTIVYPDSLVGTDSHTTMINGLGVLGWGVGGIEAEAGMLGQPLYFLTPEVVGFKMTGHLREGATATDLALTVTQKLREHKVVGKFVEFYGKGVDAMSLADRATVANMAPEYGATMGYFPVDDETLRYLELTGRDEGSIHVVKSYFETNGLLRKADAKIPAYSSVVELDLGDVVPSLAGPKRPQDRIELTNMQPRFVEVANQSVENGGFGLNEDALEKTYPLKGSVEKENDLAIADSKTIHHGAVVIAAITSCTNTSNPSVMLGAGLVAKKAVTLGLKKPSFVKSSLTPGSQVVTAYLEEAGVLPYLEKLGFHVAGYGCATCIGNSGPLPEPVANAIDDNDLTVASVLSGNRNFEGRVHPQVKANYLASPMLVVAYALAGTVNIDLYNDPIGISDDGTKIYLRDIWPTNDEISSLVESVIKPSMFKSKYEDIFKSSERFNNIPVPEGQLYQWDEKSTYIQEPPFFKGLSKKIDDIKDIGGAKVLAYLGDSVTTDHISPAGMIGVNSPAGQYLKDNGIGVRAFNSFGSRRGNHEVMMRGTFGNIRIRNKIAPGTEGGYSYYQPDKKVGSIFETAVKYQKDNTPLIVIAGKEYGTGSSRDWAAKGTNLLGVKAVIAESYERIHRSNLVGMGVLPLQFSDGISAETLGLTGYETYHLSGLTNDIKPGAAVTVIAEDEIGKMIQFEVTLRLDSEVDKMYYRNGGILHTVLRDMIH